MKFLKNEDGTMNLLPMVVIVTAICGVSFYFIFSSLINSRKVADGDNREVTTRTTVTTTIKLCNGCSMDFKKNSYNVSTNGEFDIESIINLEKIGIKFVNFTLSDDKTAAIVSKNGSYYLTTGTTTGEVTLKAEYNGLTAETKLSVVNPTNPSIQYEYPYYFVRRGWSVEPVILTEPLGVNLDGIKYTVSEELRSFASVDKNGKIRGSGNQAGSGTITLNYNGIEASTNIYVVENLINTKVNINDSYKSVREYSPRIDQFDMLIIPEDNNKNGFSAKDITVTKVSGDIDVRATYVSKGDEINSYLYHVELSGSGEATLKIELSDGSFTYFEIK